MIRRQISLLILPKSGSALDLGLSSSPVKSSHNMTCGKSCLFLCSSGGRPRSPKSEDPRTAQFFRYNSSMAANKFANPFFVVLVIAGVCFGITALAYASAAGIAQQNPEMAADSLESGHGLIAMMDRHGFKMMMVELAILAVTSVLAISTRAATVWPCLAPP